MSTTNSPFERSGPKHQDPDRTKLIESVNDPLKGCATSVQIPSQLMDEIRFHVASTGRLSMRELIRAILEAWIRKNATDIKKIKKGEVDIDPSKDRRIPEYRGGEVTAFTVWVSKECHITLKQIAAAKRSTLRGVIIAILKEWNDEKTD